MTIIQPPKAEINGEIAKAAFKQAGVTQYYSSTHAHAVTGLFSLSDGERPLTTQEYILLIDSFLNNELSAEDFAVRFQNTFSAESVFNRELFMILQDLFEDAEAYDPMWTPEEEDVFQITEPTFRNEAKDAREKLQRYIESRRTAAD